MKQYKVTYKSHQSMFSDSTYTIEVEANNKKEARDKVSFEGQGLRTILKVREVESKPICHK